MQAVRNRDSVEAVCAARSLEQCARRDLRTVLLAATISTILYSVISNLVDFNGWKLFSTSVVIVLLAGLGALTFRLSPRALRWGATVTASFVSLAAGAAALRLGSSDVAFHVLLLLPLGYALLFPRDSVPVVVGCLASAIAGVWVLHLDPLPSGQQAVWLGLLAAVCSFSLVRTFSWQEAETQERGKLAQAAEEERERERHARAIFENAGEAMLVFDERSRCLDANASALQFFGVSRQALLGTSLRRFFVRGGNQRVAARWAEALRTGRANGEVELEIHPGDVRYVEFTLISKVLPERHLAILRDVTERRKLQAGLAMMDRLASVGMLAAGVGHELNNPLAYVMGNIEYVRSVLRQVDHHGQTTLPPDTRALALRALDEASEGAERMRMVVRDLRTFSRPDDTQAGPVDIHEVLTSCISMVRIQLRHRGRLSVTLGPPVHVHGNEARLSQVFLNLLVNAAQSLSEARSATNEVHISVERLEDGRVEVRVRDTGSGIAPDVLPRIFEPFFTTKPAGIGTGLGLFICQGIVQSLGGEILVESVPGQGTCFLVRLQPAVPQAARPRPGAVGRIGAADGIRLLVIDDDPSVASCIERILAAELELSLCTSPLAALHRLTQGGETPDLILCDVLMPELPGNELYLRLRQERPELARRFLFMTAGPCSDSARALLESGEVAWLEKPFTPDGLRAFIRERLPRSHPAAA